ncbi:substrate-binding periplasmic protein [Thalassotalea marina]|uniref:ABC transporter substrate-binding protein n=1 Tax=Thalassotalea marina TaxID=1673741 RepID=A0A919BNB9_9GAMM|nr:transporter substrate-binding domain-containing protein [Thalassotalea marina]GHF98948.1 ABC transporter substrate-binding protein [Thalassotalea marina]
MKVKQLLMCSLLLFVTLASNAQHITFVTEDLPPLQINTPGSEPTGAMIELINLIIDDLQLDASIVILPWARAYNIAQNTENTFIFSMLRSKDREQLFQWVGHVYTIQAYLAALSNKNISIASIEDAKKFKIGVTRDALAETYLKKLGFINNKNMYASPTYSALWHNLLNGHTDMTFTNHIIWAPQVEKAGINPSEIALVLKVKDFDSQMYLAASNTTDPSLVNKVKISLEKIKADGRYDKILEKWQL